MAIQNISVPYIILPFRILYYFRSVKYTPPTMGVSDPVSVGYTIYDYIHIDTGNKATAVAHTHLTNCALLVAPDNRDELTYCSNDAQFHSVA